MDALGHAAPSATEDLVPDRFERCALRPDDVLIDVLYCGVWHTDPHIARDQGGHTRYPVVPGREIVGRVSAIGASVSRFRISQHVGVGFSGASTLP